MYPKLKQAYLRELHQARAADQRRDFSAAFHHLERAHILSQRYAIAHCATHLRMLHLGLRTRDRREIIGQLPRTLAALVFSRIWVPLGNTGRASVSAFKPMPVPDDLADVLAAERL